MDPHRTPDHVARRRKCSQRCF